ARRAERVRPLCNDDRAAPHLRCSRLLFRAWMLRSPVGADRGNRSVLSDTPLPARQPWPADGGHLVLLPSRHVRSDDPYTPERGGHARHAGHAVWRVHSWPADPPYNALPGAHRPRGLDPGLLGGPQPLVSRIL